MLVDSCLDHYANLFRIKADAARIDACYLVSGMWRTSTERFFQWIGGFRPSELLHVVMPYLQPLTNDQIREVANLQLSSQYSEDSLSQGINKLKMALAERIATKEILEALQGFVNQGFDFPNDNTRHRRLRRFEWGDNHPKFPFGSVVKLYAKLGLHRYNLLEGTNLQLDSLKSFTVSITGGPSSYYVSLVARVPDGGLQHFQVLVRERGLGFLDLGCPIARPLVTEPFLRPHSDPPPPPDGLFFSDELPDWPSEIAFNDRKRFHLVKESELRDNDWVRLYLELALVFHDRTLTERYLSLLEKKLWTTSSVLKGLSVV
ncbi:PREDICTED: UPF0725 protein EMB2204-like isoform X1 [Camelina sativa]|uniref:UPF0725 protein EMB2204-like isoform X1 n=2 Tax=Camelina sativa TaxID=90675 RepID=A0ABM0VR61_CAMSA|nr:PREDICTED: UPF0725 protein EMB2204-like isoform X1 [Camelina sativa]XP_010459936.1 PREDICTED: UPF0725 protein EMB2204-like isoform X1 [Camelina sativa]XP_010459937.1 PREDICTED: UPF0725 protein EMB2204-like isoform X1 [Camelina sativa]XP_010459942.1 PREDICTED: UPF0725 protein EMB2204-like isoform X1 [Camelina sativa]XP_010459943.1 PREDICTED: UPF0725 protein EMB2204-like isoform X1 [Camelina sativa]XP_010459944.1 PREDICTED: UPF0725 protein EMB2204-like isoform X1 [Camelina sativa]XP_01045994